MSSRFALGSTIVRRDVWPGGVWTVWPCRVVRDDGSTVIAVRWPGIEGLAPSTWIEWLRSGDERVREEALPHLVRGTWRLGRLTWSENIYLRSMKDDRWFSVTAVFRASDHRFRGWRVDFELPHTRRSWGIDSRDLFVDLVVHPDLTIEWKDEDEYGLARSLGLVSASDHERIEAAKAEASAMIEDRSDLFDKKWLEWRLTSTWPVPAIDLEVARAR